MKHRISLFFPLLITLVLLCLPTPEGLAPYAWHFFAIFAGAIVGLILEPLTGAVVGLTAVVVITLGSEWLLFSPEQQAAANFNLPAMNFKWAVSSFSNSTVWLIFSAFMFAAGYEKTRFGRRPPAGAGIGENPGRHHYLLGNLGFGVFAAGHTAAVVTAAGLLALSARRERKC